MADVLLGVISGLKLGVFVAVLASVVLVHRSTDLDVRPLYAVALAFLVMVSGEFVYAFGNQPEVRDQVLFPWLLSIENLHLFNDVLYLVVAVASVSFFRRVRRTFDG